MSNNEVVKGRSPRSYWHTQGSTLQPVIITVGLPSAVAPPVAAPSIVAPPVAISPAAAPTLLSPGQQEVRPAPVGPSQTPGRSATVVEIDDDDEEMDGVNSDKDMDDVDDDEGTGDADDDEGMGDVDEETFDIDRGDEELFEDRDDWVAELAALTVRVVKGYPELRVMMLGSNGKKRVAYMAKLSQVKSEKHRRSASAHNKVPPPSAKRVKGTPQSLSDLEEMSPPTPHETGSACKLSLREQERLWKLFAAERERWEIASVEDSCDRCRRKIIKYRRKDWPCLRPVKPHNWGSCCASCTSGPCSFWPPNSAWDIPPRASAPLGPPYTPSTAVRSRLPTVQDRDYPSRSSSANFSSPGPTSPSPAVRRFSPSPVARPSCLPATPSAPSCCTPRRAPSTALQPPTPVAGPSCRVYREYTSAFSVPSCI
ncbi:hypothetical protein M231_04919 [Tremella mesenterica]|uniref:Uncharacterized protein n=1 Tax=Tremella mesenterica TaxID=5217 RepID=A0A4Q1BJE9_TREME|nr:hypothetical protein M231_04919 [Tremella mesenterica]